MLSTLRKIQAFIFSTNNLVAYLTASTLSVLIAPFGTGEYFSLPILVAYWFTCNGATLLAGETIMMGILSVAPPTQPNRTFAMIGGAVLTATIVTLLVFIVNAFFFHTQSGMSDLLALAKIVWPIGFIIAVTVAFFTERLNSSDSRNTTPVLTVSPFLKRLPVHLGNELLHLTVQDHYVEAVTSKGKHLILMRFSDALSELEGVEGIQVHRSHWIAKDAMKEPIRENGRLLLKTVDNRKLPVSRSYNKQVREYFHLG